MVSPLMRSVRSDNPSQWVLRHFPIISDNGNIVYADFPVRRNHDILPPVNFGCRDKLCILGRDQDTAGIRLNRCFRGRHGFYREIRGAGVFVERCTIFGWSFKRNGSRIIYSQTTEWICNFLFCFNRILLYSKQDPVISKLLRKENNKT